MIKIWYTDIVGYSTHDWDLYSEIINDKKLTYINEFIEKWGDVHILFFSNFKLTREMMKDMIDEGLEEFYPQEKIIETAMIDYLIADIKEQKIAQDMVEKYRHG